MYMYAQKQLRISHARRGLKFMYTYKWYGKLTIFYYCGAINWKKFIIL